MVTSTQAAASTQPSQWMENPKRSTKRAKGVNSSPPRLSAFCLKREGLMRSSRNIKAGCTLKADSQHRIIPRPPM